MVHTVLSMQYGGGGARKGQGGKALQYTQVFHMVASEVGRIPCAGISPPPCIIQTFNCRDRVENNHRLDIFYVHHHPDAKTSTGCPLLC